MIFLITGLFIFVGIHLFPIFESRRSKIISTIGDKAYKIVFALLIVLSIALIVFGWKSTATNHIYDAPLWGRHVTFLFMLLAFILFVAAKFDKTNIKRFLPHPQLFAVLIWSIGHIFANGDQLSLILFSTLGIWSIVEIILISKRDGAWKKPEITYIKNDLLIIVGGGILYVVVLFSHVYISGIKLIT